MKLASGGHHVELTSDVKWVRLVVRLEDSSSAIAVRMTAVELARLVEQAALVLQNTLK